MSWWWISITVRVSQRFVGVIVIEGTDAEDAMQRAWARGVDLPEDVDHDVKAYDINAADVMVKVPPASRGVLLAENDLRTLGLWGKP